MPLSTPPEFVWRNVEFAAPGLYDRFFGRLVRALQGHNGAATSWWRSPAVNRAQGGDPLSQHLLALALDFEVDRPSDAVRSLRRQGLVAIDEGDHVHAQLFPAGVVGPFVRFLGLGN